MSRTNGYRQSQKVLLSLTSSNNSYRIVITATLSKKGKFSSVLELIPGCIAGGKPNSTRKAFNDIYSRCIVTGKPNQIGWSPVGDELSLALHDSLQSSFRGRECLKLRRFLISFRVVIQQSGVDMYEQVVYKFTADNIRQIQEGCQRWGRDIRHTRELEAN